jgi:hypothetical protein
MNNNGGCKKRQRLGEGKQQKDDRLGVDVRLSGELRGLLGRKYIKEQDLTWGVLLEYAKRQGGVTDITLYCESPTHINNNGGNKRQRLHEGEQTDDRSGVDVRLNDELRGLLGGRKYVKTKDLTREILLEYAKRQGAVTEVDLISVTVQTMGGTELEMTLDEGQNEVSWLKLAIQDEQGISVFTQQLFLVSKGGDNNAAGGSGGAGGSEAGVAKRWRVRIGFEYRGFVC